jgi:uncharacterized protein
MRIALLAAFAAVFAAAGAAPHASFDCAKAATPVEKLVCADDALAALDVQMAAVFGKLVTAHPASAAGIRSDQRAWLLQRTQCLEGPQRATHLNCLKERYQSRMALLQGNAFVVCGKPTLTGKAFALTCTAPNNPLGLSFVLSGQKADSDAVLTKLAVAKTGAKPQDFKLEGQIFFDGVGSALELMDVNFDGFADIKLATATSAGPNMGYEYWLYEPKTGAFRATKLGEQLSGFDVMADAKTKTIKVNGRSSCCSWNIMTYAWRGGALHAVASSDTMSFSPVALPGFDASGTLCGSQTKHYNDAGLVTRVDFELDSVKDFKPDEEPICDKPQLTAQGKLLDRLKANGFRVDAKDNYHFTVTFDKPRKDGE